MLEILELIFHKQFFHLLWLELGGNLGDLFYWFGFLFFPDPLRICVGKLDEL